jgi:hypothetical protein
VPSPEPVPSVPSVPPLTGPSPGAVVDGAVVPLLRPAPGVVPGSVPPPGVAVPPVPGAVVRVSDGRGVPSPEGAGEVW